MFDEKSSRAKLNGVKPQNKGAEFNKMLEDYMAPQKPKISQPKPAAKTTKSPKLVGKATPESVGKLLQDTKFTWEVAKRVPGSLPYVMAEYDRQNPTASPATRERIKRATIIGKESGLDYESAMSRALVADSLPANYDFEGTQFGPSDSTDLRNANDVMIQGGLEQRRLKELAFRKAWISEQQRVSTPENMVFGDVFLDPEAAEYRKYNATFGEIVVENYIRRHGISRTLNGLDFALDTLMLIPEVVVSPISSWYEYGTREEEKDDWVRTVANAADFLPGIVTGGAAVKAGTWVATKIGAKLAMKGVARAGIAGATSRILAKGGLGAGTLGFAADMGSGLVTGAYSASPGNIPLGFQRMGEVIGGMVAGLGDAEKWKSSPGEQANAAVQTAFMVIGLLAGAASARNVYKNLLGGAAPPHSNPVVAAADTLAAMDDMGLDGAVATAVAQIAKDVDLDTPVHGGIADQLADLESQGVEVPASLIDAAPVLDAAVRQQAEKAGVDVDEATAAAALDIVNGIKEREDIKRTAAKEPTVTNARTRAAELLNAERITPEMAQFVEDNFGRGTMLPADPDAAVKAITAAMARKSGGEGVGDLPWRVNLDYPVVRAKPPSPGMSPDEAVRASVEFDAQTISDSIAATQASFKSKVQDYQDSVPVGLRSDMDRLYDADDGSLYWAYAAVRDTLKKHWGNKVTLWRAENTSNTAKDKRVSAWALDETTARRFMATDKALVSREVLVDDIWMAIRTPQRPLELLVTVKPNTGLSDARSAQRISTAAADAAPTPKPKRQSTAQKLREAAEKATDDVESAKAELDAAHKERIGSAPKRRSSRSKQGGYVDLGAFAPPTLREMEALVGYIAAKLKSGAYDLAAAVADLGDRFDVSTIMRARAHAIGGQAGPDLASINIRVDGKLHELTGQAAREVKALRDDFLRQYLGASGSKKMQLQGNYYTALRILLDSHNANQIMDGLDKVLGKRTGDFPAMLKERLDEINHKDVAVVLKWVNYVGDADLTKLMQRMNTARKKAPLKQEDVEVHLDILADMELVTKTVQADGSTTYKVNQPMLDSLLADKGIGPKLIGDAVVRTVKWWKDGRGKLLAEALYDPGIDLASDAFVKARAAGAGDPAATAKAWFNGNARSQDAYQVLVDGIAEMQVKLRENSAARRLQYAKTAAGWVKEIEAIWKGMDAAERGLQQFGGAVKAASTNMYSTAEFLFRNYGTKYKEFMDVVRADIESSTAAAKHIEIASAQWLRDRWYRKDEFVRKLAGDLAAKVITFDDFEIGMRGRGFSGEQIASVVDDIDRFRNIAAELRNSVNQSRAVRGEKLVGDLGDEYFTAAYAQRTGARDYDPGQLTTGALSEGGKLTGARPGTGVTPRGTIETDATKTRTKEVTERGAIDFITSAEGYIRDMSYEAAMGSAWDKLVIARNLISGQTIEEAMYHGSAKLAQNVDNDPALKAYFEEQINKIQGKPISAADAETGFWLSLTKLPLLAFNIGSVVKQYTALAAIGGQSGPGVTKATLGAHRRTIANMAAIIKHQGLDALGRMGMEVDSKGVPELGSAWMLSEQLRTTYAAVPKTGTGKGFKQKAIDVNAKGMWLMTQVQDSMYKLAFEANFYARMQQLAREDPNFSRMDMNERVNAAVKYADRELRELYPVSKEDRGTIWDSPTMRNLFPFAQEMTQVSDRMIANMFPRYDEFGNRIKWREDFKAAAVKTAKRVLVMQATAFFVNAAYQQTIGERPIPFDVGSAVARNLPQAGALADPGAEDIGFMDHVTSAGLEMFGDFASTNVIGRAALGVTSPFASPKIQEMLGIDQGVGGVPGVSNIADVAAGMVQGDYDKSGQKLSLMMPAGLQLQKTWGGIKAMMAGELESGNKSYAMDEGWWAWLKAATMGPQTASHAYKAAKAAKRGRLIGIRKSESSGGLRGMSGLGNSLD